MMLAFVGLALSTAACPAQCYTANQVRDDLDYLHRMLPETHANLYARRTKVDYDREYHALRSEIRGPMPKAEAHLLFQRYLAFGKFGHLKTDAPVTDVLLRVQQGGKVLPLLGRKEPDGAVVLTDWSSNDLPPGTKILKIGERAVDDVLKEIRSLVSADNEALFEAQLEEALPIYLNIIFGDVAAISVTYVDDAGTTHDALISAVDLPAFQALGKDKPLKTFALSSSKREFRLLGDGVAYLRPGPFGNIDGEVIAKGLRYDPRPFDEFLTKSFSDLGTSSDLVIDLRNNAGGDVSFSNLLVARLAKEPFSFASRYQVRASAANKARIAASPPEEGSLVALIASSELRTSNGDLFDVTLPLVQPRTDNRFDGRVWVLVDRHSYSNAAVVAAQLKDLGIATLLGEDTSDLASTFGAAELFVLPETKVEVTYPKSELLRLSGKPGPGGVEVDIRIPRQPIGNPVDERLRIALRHIIESRRDRGADSES